MVNDVISNTFERHAQTALVLLLVTILIWVGNTTQNTAVSVAEMRVELAYLKRAVDTPTAIHEQTTHELRDLERRVSAIEEREHL
jgi:hypothetical protein